MFPLMSAMRPDTWVSADSGLTQNLTEQFRSSPNGNHPSSNDDSALGSSIQNLGFVGSNGSSASSVPQTSHFNPTFGGASAPPAASYLASALESVSSGQAFQPIREMVVWTGFGLDEWKCRRLGFGNFDQCNKRLGRQAPERATLSATFANQASKDDLPLPFWRVWSHGRAIYWAVWCGRQLSKRHHRRGHQQSSHSSVHQGWVVQVPIWRMWKARWPIVVPESSCCQPHHRRLHRHWTQSNPPKYRCTINMDNSLRKFGANILQHPRGVCVDNQGRIIVVECKVMRVIIFDSYGNVQQKFSCSRYLEFPNGVCANDKNEIFISDNRAHCVKVCQLQRRILAPNWRRGIDELSNR